MRIRGYSGWSWCPLADLFIVDGEFVSNLNLLKMRKNGSIFLSSASRFAVSRLRPFVLGKSNFAMKMSMERTSSETDSGKPNSSKGETSPRATLSTTNATWTDPGWNPGFRVYRRKLPWIMLERGVHAVQQTHFLSTMKTKSVLCSEIIAVGSESHVKHINALRGYNCRVFVRR